MSTEKTGANGSSFSALRNATCIVDPWWMSEMAIFRQFGALFFLSYTVGNTDMQESAKLRRGKLIEEIRRYRDVLSMMKFVDQRAPSSAKKQFASRNQEIAERLRSIENELHDLNVQLIREELSADSLGRPPKPLGG